VDVVENNYHVLPGDLVQTAPGNPLLPVSVTIGTVEQVEDSPEHAGLQSLTVRPLADLSSLRDVYIVRPLFADLDGGDGGGP
jgi:cell shape-determining protein MreC